MWPDTERRPRALDLQRTPRRFEPGARKLDTKERDRWPGSPRGAGKHEQQEIRGARSSGSCRAGCGRAPPGRTGLFERRRVPRRPPLVTGALSASRLGRLARGKLRDAVRCAPRFSAFTWRRSTSGSTRRPRAGRSKRSCRAAVTAATARGPKSSAWSCSPVCSNAPTSSRRANARAIREHARDASDLRCGRAGRAATRARSLRTLVVSFTRGTSDLLEVLLLARAARLGPTRSGQFHCSNRPRTSSAPGK